jgi:hypothetical protein
MSDENSLARNGSESACEASQRASLVGASVGEAVASTCKEIFRASFAGKRAYEGVLSACEGVSSTCEGVSSTCEGIASACEVIMLVCEVIMLVCEVIALVC